MKAQFFLTACPLRELGGNLNFDELRHRIRRSFMLDNDLGQPTIRIRQLDHGRWPVNDRLTFPRRDSCCFPCRWWHLLLVLSSWRRKVRTIPYLDDFVVELGRLDLSGA
jgi:hypothetical protein